jgi:hypothetical protein
MLKIVSGKIGLREFLSIFIFSLVIKLTESTPVLMVKYGGTGGWILPIISYLVILIPFLIIQRLLKENKNKGLLDIIAGYGGNYIGFLIGNVLLLVTISSLILSCNNYVHILSTMYFPKSPILAIYICLVCLSCFAATKGIIIVGRACLIALPYMVIVIILLMISIWTQLDYRLALPIGGTGVIEELKSGFKFSSILGDCIVLSVFFPYAKNYSEYKIASNIGLLISAVMLSLFNYAFLTMFGFSYLRILSYPYHELIRTARLGDAINNIDAFYLGFWLMLAAGLYSKKPIGFHL